MILYSILALLIIAADQITKLIVSPTTNIKLIPGIINITYHENTGAAFGILQNQVSILGIVSVLFCIGLVIYILRKKPESTLQKISFMLIFAGAAGNAIDRIFRNGVIDFIETAFMDFPIFNVADIAITVGAILLVVYVIFFEKSN